MRPPPPPRTHEWTEHTADRQHAAAEFCLATCIKYTPISVGRQDDWDHLVELVRTTATSRLDTLDADLAWLARLGSLKERFAYCYTWGKCTLGVFSTQRAECMQNRILF